MMTFLLHHCGLLLDKLDAPIRLSMTQRAPKFGADSDQLRQPKTGDPHSWWKDMSWFPTSRQTARVAHPALQAQPPVAVDRWNMRFAYQ